MRQVLIVAYYFPPIGGIGSIRLGSFARFLPEFGWEPTILTPEDTPHAPDPTLDTAGLRIVRTRSLELSRLGRRPATGGRSHDGAGPRQAATRSAPSRALRSAAKRLVFPDAQIGWYPWAAARGLRLLRERPFDVVFSSAFPVTSHLVARTLKRRSSLRWVAEWRDPWSDDPRFRAVSAAALRVERAVAAEADAVALPNQMWADYYTDRWGVRASVIGHGSDTAFNRAAPRPHPPVLAHVGSYLPDRQSFDTLWSALAELRRRGEPIPRLRWVGTFPEEARAELARYGLEDTLEVTGFVSHADALSVMSEASALVACGYVDTGPLSMGFRPAKLLEYLASGVPVIYVGHPHGEAAGMLSKYSGCHTVPFGDVEGAIRALQAALADGVHQRELDGLTRRARTAELAELFDAVVARRAGG